MNPVPLSGFLGFWLFRLHKTGHPPHIHQLKSPKSQKAKLSGMGPEMTVVHVILKMQ